MRSTSFHWRLRSSMPRAVVLQATPAAQKANRHIPLNGDAIAFFRLLRQRAEIWGATQPEHYVFPARAPHGQADPTRHQKSWRAAWRSLTRAAGLRGLRFHDLRHHAINELLENGVPEHVVMGVAGHISPEMLEVYSHPRIDAKRQALARIGIRGARETVAARADNVTRRQRQVARLLAKGMDYSTIGEKLGISLQTVKGHAHNIRAAVLSPQDIAKSQTSPKKLPAPATEPAPASSDGETRRLPPSVTRQVG